MLLLRVTGQGSFKADRYSLSPSRVVDADSRLARLIIVFMHRLAERKEQDEAFFYSNNVSSIRTFALPSRCGVTSFWMLHTDGHELERSDSLNIQMRHTPQQPSGAIITDHRAGHLFVGPSTSAVVE